jgi:hypothetical protein
VIIHISRKETNKAYWAIELYATKEGFTLGISTARRTKGFL